MVGPAPASPAGSGVAGCLVLLCGAVLVRSVRLNVARYADELYTMLPARGWVEHGVPTIAKGASDLAWLHTVIVGRFLQAFGDNLIVGRLPSLIAGSLLVVAVFLWTRSVAGALLAVSNGDSTRTLLQPTGLKVVTDVGGAGIRESRRIADGAAARRSGPCGPRPRSRSPRRRADLPLPWRFRRRRQRQRDVRDQGPAVRHRFPYRPAGCERARAMRLILEGCPDGLVVALTKEWRGAELEAVEAAAAPAPLPAAIGMQVFHWQYLVDRPLPAGCAKLPPVGRAAGQEAGFRPAPRSVVQAPR